MNHSGISGTYTGGDVLQIDFLPNCQRHNQIIDIVNNSVLELVESVVLLAVNNSSNVIFAETYLAVVGRFAVDCC